MGVLEEGPPKASQEAIWRDKGGIPKVVPPFPSQRCCRPGRESSLGKKPETWPHVKIDDSYTFWKDFGSCQGDREDLFGVCI